MTHNAWANPYLGGANDLKYIKKGYFLKSCLTDDERRHPLLEHLPTADPTRASPPVGIIPPWWQPVQIIM